MVTKDQALIKSRFIYHGLDRQGKPKDYAYRRNGQTKTWKRSPDRFQIPVKYGLYEFGYITEQNADKFDAID
jgi:hypothetical protein